MNLSEQTISQCCAALQDRIHYCKSRATDCEALELTETAEAWRERVTKAQAAYDELIRESTKL